MRHPVRARPDVGRGAPATERRRRGRGHRAEGRGRDGGGRGPATRRIRRAAAVSRRGRPSDRTITAAGSPSRRYWRAMRSATAAPRSGPRDRHDRAAETAAGQPRAEHVFVAAARSRPARRFPASRSRSRRASTRATRSSAVRTLRVAGAKRRDRVEHALVLGDDVARPSRENRIERGQMRQRIDARRRAGTGRRAAPRREGLAAPRRVFASGVPCLTPESMTMRSIAGGSGMRSNASVRVSRNSASPSRPRLEAIWSMMPTGAPTKSVSARVPTRASATSSSGSAKRVAQRPQDADFERGARRHAGADRHGGVKMKIEAGQVECRSRASATVSPWT